MVKNLKESKTTTHARRLYVRGCQLQQAGKLDEAVSELSRAIECDARCAEAYFSRGACHYMLGHYRLARNDLDAAAVLGCEEALLWSRYDNRSYEHVEETNR